MDSLKNAGQYKISIDSAGVTDWYGQTNQDSISITLQTRDPEDLGAINLNVVKSDSLVYIMEVLKGDKVVEKRVLLESGQINLSSLEQGKYKVKLVQDLNGDGKWSAGLVKEKRRSERKTEVELESLKAGWELEAEINLTELFDATEGK